METFDYVVIGGGLVGLAIAKTFSEDSIGVILEKEKNILSSTSSRNSEVIHSGIYYQKESLKSKLCTEGKNKLYEYCHVKNIKNKNCGKLIISNDISSEKIESLYKNGIRNGIDDLILLEKKEINYYESQINANYAIYSPSSGVLDTHTFGESLVSDIEKNDGLVLRLTEFIAAEESGEHIKVKVRNPDETEYEFLTKCLINSAGHDALRIEKKLPFGFDVSHLEDFPIKGNYFSYSGKNPFSHLIYPMPDELGLGIHSTQNIANELKFGPDVDQESTSYAVNESKLRTFYELIKKWWPEIDFNKLNPSYVGIRPKIKNSGSVMKDFLIQHKQINQSTYISLLGIESPGITASLAIGNYCYKYYR